MSHTNRTLCDNSFVFLNIYYIGIYYVCLFNVYRCRLLRKRLVNLAADPLSYTSIH